MIKKNNLTAISFTSRLSQVSLVLLSLSLAGCASPNKEHFYQLSYAHHEPASSDTKYDVILEAVTIPEMINRPQLVVQKSVTELQILDEQRWIAPLDEQIRQALQADLQAQLPQAWLHQRPLLHATGVRYFVNVEVQQLHIAPAKEVQMEMVWVISDTNKKILRRQQLQRSVALNNNDYSSIAPAISEVLQKLSISVANDIKAVGETPNK